MAGANQVNGANAAKLTNGDKVPQAIKHGATNALSNLAGGAAGGIGGPVADIAANAAVQAATTANLGPGK